MRTFGFFMISLKISLRLHDSLFNGIIRAFMYFFHTNPSGRILNRFSSDITNVDVALPQAMLDSLEVNIVFHSQFFVMFYLYLLQFLVNSFAVLVIVAIANYWLLVPALIMILLLFFCRGLYIGSSRSLKRMEVMCEYNLYANTYNTKYMRRSITKRNNFSICYM